MMAVLWRWTDVLWIGFLVIQYVCCVNGQIPFTDNVSLLTERSTQATNEHHTPNHYEKPGQRTENTEFSAVIVNQSKDSITTKHDNSEIPPRSSNTNSSETTDTIWDEEEHTDTVVSRSGTSVGSNKDQVDKLQFTNAAKNQGRNIVAAVGSPNSNNMSFGIVHVVLFTSWQMIVVMICIEIFAYCVTIFIIFGFGKKRSRAKRFGHFSWKRPGPFKAQQETTFSIPIDTPEHHFGTSPTEETQMMKAYRPMVKKPSIRGHRP